MSETTAPEGVQDPADGAAEEVVPDYTRVGFKALRVLCKERGLSAEGNSIALVERLQAWDAQHGKTVDLSAVEDLDPLGLDDDDTPESPVGGGEAASASSPTGAPTAGEDVIGIGTTATAGIVTGLPEGSSITSAAPAVVVRAEPEQGWGLPSATTKTGKADLTVRDGLVRVGQGHGAAEVRAFRVEYPHGPREITDNDHFGYIAETHAAAHAKGLQTKGGVTVGERVGEGRDADGRRTVIYQVPLKRQQ